MKYPDTCENILQRCPIYALLIFSWFEDEFLLLPPFSGSFPVWKWAEQIDKSDIFLYNLSFCGVFHYVCDLTNFCSHVLSWLANFFREIFLLAEPFHVWNQGINRNRKQKSSYIPISLKWRAGTTKLVQIGHLKGTFNQGQLIPEQNFSLLICGCFWKVLHLWARNVWIWSLYQILSDLLLLSSCQYYLLGKDGRRMATYINAL